MYSLIHFDMENDFFTVGRINCLLCTYKFIESVECNETCLFPCKKDRCTFDVLKLWLFTNLFINNKVCYVISIVQWLNGYHRKLA